MKPDAIGCCPRAARRRGWAAGGAIFTVLAALTPKCPLCVAGWLSVLGLSGLAARADARALWLGAALAVAATSALLLHRALTWKETRS